MFKYRLLLAGVGILLLAIAADAQFPQGGGGGMPSGGGPGGGGFSRGGGMMGGDPNALFERFSGGNKDVIVLNNLDERTRGSVERMAQFMSIPITNGQITRAEFVQAATAFGEKMKAGGGFAGFGKGKGGMQGGGAPLAAGPSPGGPAAPGGSWQGRGSGGGGSGGWSGGQGGPDWSGGGVEAFAESRFRRADKNNDGVLEADEMDDALLAEKDKWDTNRDGVIDLTEYKAYFAARMQAIRTEREGMNPFAPKPDDPGEEQDKKPTVYRSGKLPRELPAWFAQLDTDGDMQIGLYEWKKSGKTIKEFRDMDRNGDNFLTIDEVLFYVKAKSPANNGTAVASATGAPAGPAGPAGPGGFNGMPVGGRGMGMFPGGGGNGMPVFMPQGGDQNSRGRGPGGFPSMGGNGGQGSERMGGGRRERGGIPGGPGAGSPVAPGADAAPKDKSGNGMERPGGRQKGMGKGGYPKGSGD